jgi:hypothetical protein
MHSNISLYIYIYKIIVNQNFLYVQNVLLCYIKNFQRFISIFLKIILNE